MYISEQDLCISVTCVYNAIQLNTQECNTSFEMEQCLTRTAEEYNRELNSAELNLTYDTLTGKVDTRLIQQERGRK